MHSHERHGVRAQLAPHERQVNRAIHMIFEAEHAKRPELSVDGSLGNTLDQAVLLESIADEVRDRSDLELVLARELLEVRTTRHRSIFVQDLDDDRGGLHARKPREIATRLGMTRA